LLQQLKQYTNSHSLKPNGGKTRLWRKWPPGLCDRRFWPPATPAVLLFCSTLEGNHAQPCTLPRLSYFSCHSLHFVAEAE
jgi:hypothetical protein